MQFRLLLRAWTIALFGFACEGASDLDGSALDAHTRMDAGSYCTGYCRDLVDCLGQRSQDELTNRHGPSTCRPNGVEPDVCVSLCENAQSEARRCSSCAEQCDVVCLSRFCDLTGNRLQQVGAESLECWVGETEPESKCMLEQPDPTYAVIETKPDNQFIRELLRYDGLSTVTATVPLTLATPETSFVIQTSLPPLDISVGDQLQLEAEIQCPFWCSSAFVLRTVSGELLQAGWLLRRPLPVPEFEITFVPSQCLSTTSFGLQGLAFDARVDGRVVASGSSADLASLRFHNTFVSRFSLWLNDTPNDRILGAIEKIQ